MLHKSLVRMAMVWMAGLLVIGTLAGLACSKKSASTGDITVTSSIDSGHSHAVTVLGADIETPPATDQTIDTTSSGGHKHTITLTSQDYQSIKDGNEVTVTSSSNSGHTHTFKIKK
jgi:hypothetical protein